MTDQYPPPPPPPGPPNQPPGWGLPPAPGYMAPANLYGGPRNNGKAITALVLGICAFIPMCYVSWLPCGILAIVFGRIARREIRESGGLQQGDGMAKAGLICGSIALALYVVLIAVIIAVIVLGNTNNSTS